MIFIFVNGKNVHKTLIILSKLCYCYVYDSLVLVAQWTRARGYEPRCRGFESLLAQDFSVFFYCSYIPKKKLDRANRVYTIMFFTWGVAKW